VPSYTEIGDVIGSLLDGKNPFPSTPPPPAPSAQALAAAATVKPPTPQVQTAPPPPSVTVPPPVPMGAQTIPPPGIGPTPPSVPPPPQARPAGVPADVPPNAPPNPNTPPIPTSAAVPPLPGDTPTHPTIPSGLSSSPTTSPTSPATSSGETPQNVPAGSGDPEADKLQKQWDEDKAKANQPPSKGQRNTSLIIALASALFGGSRLGNAAGAFDAGLAKGQELHQEQLNTKVTQDAQAYDNYQKALDAQAVIKQRAEDEADRVDNQHTINQWHLGQLGLQVHKFGLSEKEFQSISAYRLGELDNSRARINMSYTVANMSDTVRLQLGALQAATADKRLNATYDGFRVRTGLETIKGDLYAQVKAATNAGPLADPAQVNAAVGAALQTANTQASALLGTIPKNVTMRSGTPYSALSELGVSGAQGVNLDYNPSYEPDYSAPQSLVVPQQSAGGGPAAPTMGQPAGGLVGGLPPPGTSQGGGGATPHWAQAQMPTEANPNPPTPPAKPIDVGTWTQLANALHSDPKGYKSIADLDTALHTVLQAHNMSITPQQQNFLHVAWYDGNGIPIPGTHHAGTPGQAQPQAHAQSEDASSNPYALPGFSNNDKSRDAYLKYRRALIGSKPASDLARGGLSESTIDALARTQAKYSGPGEMEVDTKQIGQGIMGGLSHAATAVENFLGVGAESDKQDMQTTAQSLRSSGISPQLAAETLQIQFHVPAKDALNAYYGGQPPAVAQPRPTQQPQAQVHKPNIIQKTDAVAQPHAFRDTMRRVVPGDPGTGSAENVSVGRAAPGGPPPRTANPGAPPTFGTSPMGAIKTQGMTYAQFIPYVAKNTNVPESLILAIINRESGGNVRATSKTGAQGLMQLEPGTARSLGVTNPYDPVQNITAGTNYLSSLLSRYHGNIRLAVAAYNAGPGAVDKYHGVPPYAETIKYVQNVLSDFQAYSSSNISDDNGTITKKF
jgi:hypothetical protein